MQTLEKPDEMSLFHNQIHCSGDQIKKIPNSVPFYIKNVSSFGVEKLIWNKIDKLYVKGKMVPKDIQALLPGACEYVS